MDEWVDGIKHSDGVALEAERDIVEARIKEGTVRIGNSAFEQCQKLSEVHIPEGVLSIGNMAFEDCGSLTSITLPDSLRCIGNHAFMRSGLTAISIPQHVVSIPFYAFP